MGCLIVRRLHMIALMKSFEKIKMFEMKPVNSDAYHVTQPVSAEERARKKQHRPQDVTSCTVCGSAILRAKLARHMRRAHGVGVLGAKWPRSAPFNSLNVAHVVITKETKK
jgi:hypothetical protein